MPKISEVKRELVVAYSLDGLSTYKIAERLKISRGAVQHILRKHKDGLPVNLDLKRSGRPKKLSQRQESMIIREAKKDNILTANEIRRSQNLTDTVSTDTVKRILRKGHLYGRVAKRRPLLTKCHKKKRMEFCLKKRGLSSVDWHKYIFSDECILSIGNHSRTYVRRPPMCRKCKYNDKYTSKTQKFAPSIMVWGAIRYDGRRQLILCNKNVDSTEYIRMLKKAFPNIYNNRFIFQQDGARCHTSKETVQYFKKNEIRYLKDWPAQSPDINLIENLWSYLKEEVKKINPTNIEDLWNAAYNIWQEISDLKIQQLYESMPERINLQ